MASLGMKGSYAFNEGTIKKEITKTSAGNYALGYEKDDGTYIVQYVGRSDSDVGGRLSSHIGKKYSEFKYSYATSPKAAFEKECENYHDFGGNKKLHNEIHPDRPQNSSWKCPRCNVFEK